MLKGRTHEAVSSAAVLVSGETGKRSLILDGSRTIDPYFMVHQVKKMDLSVEEILGKITIGRAFTAYQLKDLVDKAERNLKKNEDFALLGTIGLSAKFEDDQLSAEEGRWLRSKVSRRIKKMVEEESLYGIAVDTEPWIFKH
ncbi:MAG: hypothetical protein KGY76_06320 [Candidatus Thermoplasmatota archaeon]|nr:hypothetical protein [Candidatus Thermoplasmatota archaeon]